MMEYKINAESFAKTRVKLGLGVASMGRALGVSRQTIYNIESGLKPITPVMARAISWMAELVELDPSNERLPSEVRRGK